MSSNSSIVKIVDMQSNLKPIDKSVIYLNNGKIDPRVLKVSRFFLDIDLRFRIIPPSKERILTQISFSTSQKPRIKYMEAL